MTQFKDFLTSLLPVAEELGDKDARVVIESAPELNIELRTFFNKGKVERKVVIGLPS